jgi:hypothetical protein
VFKNALQTEQIPAAINRCPANRPEGICNRTFQALADAMFCHPLQQ